MTSEQNSENAEPAGSPEPSDSTTDESVSTAEDSDSTDVPTAVVTTAKSASAKTAPAKSASAEGPRHWLSSLFLATGVAALAAAVACLGYFGYVGIHAYVSDDGPITQLRDESVDVAEQAVVNATTIDVDDLDGWDRRLKDTMTGDALKQASSSELRKMFDTAKKNGGAVATITSRITGAAPTEVNLDEDKATVLVFGVATQEVKATREKQQLPLSFLVTVVNVDGKRKVSVMAPLDGIQYTEDGAAPKEGGR